MSERPAIGVGVIGLGFMGRTHLAAYRSAAAAGLSNRVVAVSDQSPERRAGRAAAGGNLDSGASEEQLFDPRAVRAYERPEDLLADEAVELVSICTPTDTHVELALAALAAGKHVLVEKPVALRSADVARLAQAAEGAPTYCMPAMCIRFWPAYAYLREAIADHRHRALHSATFTRLTPPPTWSPEFYRDPARCGGALVDLHAHDADFILSCLGAPIAVTSTGTPDHLTTFYHYPSGPAHVVAEGGWDLASSCDFRMRYTVAFERATLDFDLAREPELLLFREQGRTRIQLETANGYELEIRHLLDCIRHRTPPESTLAQAHLLTRVLEAERASLETEARVELE